MHAEFGRYYTKYIEIILNLELRNWKWDTYLKGIKKLKFNEIDFIHLD
jgi:hypothetical protein